MRELIVFLAVVVLGGCAGITFHGPSLTPLPPGRYVEKTVSPSGEVTTTVYEYYPAYWGGYCCGSTVIQFGGHQSGNWWRYRAY